MRKKYTQNEKYVILNGGDDTMSFGSRLRELRIVKQISQKKLADEINISGNTISQYETDKRFPDESTLIRLCKYYEISSDYLLGLTDVKHSPLTEEEAIKRMFTQRQLIIYKQLVDIMKYQDE
jgi:transcriptional regulator with XRE-family HTH domain